MININLTGTIATFLLVSVVPVFAQGVSTMGSGYMLTEEDFFADIPKVITASRLVQPINEAPAALTVIDREMIEASGARNLVDVFRLVPGFIVGYWSGSQQMTTYQGMGSAYVKQLQVLIDGRAMYIPSLGGVPWAEIPLALSEIKRIEVTRGPNSVNYGSNSFFAVINIITEQASDMSPIEVVYRTGSDDLKDFEVSEAITSDRFSLRATVVRRTDEGFTAFYDNNDINIMNFRSDYSEKDGDRWSYFVGQSTGTQGRGDYIDPIDVDRDVKTISNYQHIRWQSAPTKYGEWVVQGYRTYHEYGDEYTSDAIPGYPNGVDIDQTYASRRYDVEIQNTLSLDHWLRLVWGTSYRQDQVVSDSYFRDRGHQNIDVNRYFINTEWRPFNPLLIHLGTMLEDHEYTGKDWSPRVAISYSPFPNHTFRASQSLATRTPTAFEENTDTKLCGDPACTIYDAIYYSDGGLEREKIDSREIAYVGRILNNTMLDIRLYKNRVEDIISIYPLAVPGDIVDGTASSFDNIHDADISGGELQLVYKNKSDRFIVAYAHNHVKAEGWYKPERVEQSFPEENLSVLWARNFSDGYSTAIKYYYTDSLRHLDGDKNPLTGLLLDPVKRLDIQLGKRYDFGKSRLKIITGVQNIMDEYIEYRNENTVDARYYVNISGELR
jgi:iron complex outermembrane receptor protein